MNFREFLLENMQTKLAIFDFDQTLANSPEKPTGWRTGEKRADWWTHQDSLSQPLYDGSFKEPVIKAFLAARNDPNTRTILLTGRDGVLASQMVRQHMRNQNLYGKRIIAPSNTDATAKQTDQHHLDDAGHEEYYKGDFRTEPDYPKNHNGKPSVDTLDHKRYVIQRLMHPGIREIEFWDDRDEHLQPFISFFQELARKYPVKVTIHHVTGDDIKVINISP